MAKWVIDPDHSVAVFSIRHMMIANVHGHFNKIKGTIYFDPDDVIHSSVEVSIDVSSICTGIKKRNEHLCSPDFFDVEKYPEILFKSTKVESTGSRGCNVNGDLTIHGVTKPVTLKAEYFGPIKSPFGATSLGFSVTTRINREDFGITWNMDMESGGVMVGRDVEIILDVEADLVVE